MKTTSKKLSLSILSMAFIGLVGIGPSYGDDVQYNKSSEQQRMEDQSRQEMEAKKTDAEKSAKDAKQKAEDCKMVNGKMECPKK